MARDLILIGSIPIHVECIDGWWLVWSANDWLREPNGSVSYRNFDQIVHFPEAGREACRSEILLRAFADTLITRGANDELTWIEDKNHRGMLPTSVLDRVMQKNVGRTVVFTSREEP
jgi:hypothetical protein